MRFEKFFMILSATGVLFAINSGYCSLRMEITIESVSAIAVAICGRPAMQGITPTKSPVPYIIVETPESMNFEYTIFPCWIM